jgi:hypothetical protein
MFRGEEDGRTMKFKKGEILEHVKRNKGQHAKIFAEAIEGYRKKAVDILNKNIAAIKEGRIIRSSISIPPPENHIKDYEVVASMLEMTTEDVVELNGIEFRRYVKDDWEWKGSFINSNSAYSSTAASAAQANDAEGLVH